MNDARQPAGVDPPHPAGPSEPSYPAGPPGPPSATPSEPAPFLAWRPLLFALLLCLPFWFIWLRPVFEAPAGQLATGFPQYDQAYYAANGRAIFERGNGFSGPNPYDPDPAAPAIYFHLLNWFFGLLVAKVGLDPGFVYVATGLVAGLLFARLTLALLERLVASRRSLRLLFPLAMWGSGIAALTFFFFQSLGMLQPGTTPYVFEPDRGWWFLYWGRNLVFTTEAVYHCLVLGIWLAFLERRWWILTLLTFLLAATHPFTALQMLLPLGTWICINLTFPGKTAMPRLPLAVIAVLAAIASTFVAYYGIYLPSHGSHVALNATWTVTWQETPMQTLCAYLPLAIAVVFAVRQRRLLPRPELVFFGLFALSSFLLSHHGWFMKAYQPLHFSRGYVWMPLFLVALPWLERAIAPLLVPGFRRRLAALAVILLAAADNLVFVFAASREPPATDVRYIDAELRHVFRLLDREKTQGVMISSDPAASYLVATYTQVRPYFGHLHNTSERDQRLAELDQFFRQSTRGPLILDADLLLLKGSLASGQPGWRSIYQGERWNLYRRVP